MRAHEFTEAFNAVYPITWSGALDAYFSDKHNQQIHVSFGDFAEGAIWYVSFDIENNHDLTGSGDEFRIFATVIAAIQEFIAREQPGILTFVSAKSDASRTPLYKRMVDRLTSGTNYVDISRNLSVVKDLYVRSRVEKMQKKFESVDTFFIANRSVISNVINELALSKNSWQVLHSNTDKSEVSDELVNLVQTAYKNAPQGSFVQSAMQVMPSDWYVVDWDQDPDVDVTVFYRGPRGAETWTGHKIQGIGHDGTRPSKDRAVSKMEQLLHQPGWWVESSDAMQYILRKRNLQAVTDVGFLRQLFNDPNLTMIDSDTYQRHLADGSVITETVFGKPTLK